MTKMPQPGWTTRAVVTRVVDGDTVEVELRRRIRVRLLDCWAPETKGHDPEKKAAGEAAREHLEKILPVGNDVILEVPTDVEGDATRRPLGTRTSALPVTRRQMARIHETSPTGM